MLSQAIVPVFNAFVIEALGWRNAWRVNALIIWLVLLPIVAILVRNHPADVGQLPDGVQPNDVHASPSEFEEPGFTSNQALRTPAFWRLIGASAVPSLVVTGLAFNQIAILTDRGFPASLAASSFAIEAAVALPATLGAG